MEAFKLLNIGTLFRFAKNANRIFWNSSFKVFLFCLIKLYYKT